MIMYLIRLMDPTHNFQFRFSLMVGESFAELKFLAQHFSRHALLVTGSGTFVMNVYSPTPIRLGL